MAESSRGRKHSIESRQRMSEIAKQREAKKYAEGYSVSDETRQKISAANTGKKRNPETRQKMSEKAKIREDRKKSEGYTVSDETRIKNSKASQKM